MVFWGVEVRPGKPFYHNFDLSSGRLRISQATLGDGTSELKSTILCNVGNSSPIALCTLIPNVCETCHLELEFEEDKEVIFSILGPRSIHLTGYYPGHSRHLDGDDTESYGEDIAESDTSDSYTDGIEDEYESDFIDDNDDVAAYAHFPVHKSNVVIEEIEDDGKPCDRNRKLRRLKKKHEVSDSEDAETGSKQVILRNNGFKEDESEDEDGFPICFTASKSSKRKVYDGGQSKSDGSSKFDGISQDIVSVSEAKENHDSKRLPETSSIYDEKPKKKKKKDCKRSVGSENDAILNRRSENAKMEEKTETGATLSMEEIQGHSKESLDGAKHSDNVCTSAPATSSEPDACKISKKKKNTKSKRAREEAISDGKIPCKEKNDADNIPQDDKMPTDNDSSPTAADVIMKKKKTKKNKKRNSSSDINHEAFVEQKNDVMDGIDDSQHGSRSIKTRTFQNGLIVEEVSMGKPEGRKASPGKKVSVHYIGKLKNGTIFDSNIGQRPFKFRLGIGEVIKGWEIGVTGMRVGDKRRLTVPPSFGYGAKGAGKIPPNSWLVFDVELVDVE